VEIAQASRFASLGQSSLEEMLVEMLEEMLKDHSCLEGMLEVMLMGHFSLARAPTMQLPICEGKTDVEMQARQACAAWLCLLYFRPFQLWALVRQPTWQWG